MGKDNTKNLVGQPIFKQIIKMLPREQFDLSVKQCGSDRYYKTFFSWDQLIVMLFGIFSHWDSLWAKLVTACVHWKASWTTWIWIVHRQKALYAMLYVTGRKSFLGSITLHWLHIFVRFCHHKWSKNAWQKVFSTLKTVKRQHAGIRQGI